MCCSGNVMGCLTGRGPSAPRARNSRAGHPLRASTILWRYESSLDFRQRLRAPFPLRILAKFIPGGAGIGIPFYMSPLNIIYLHQAASRSRCKNWDFSRSRFVMGASHFTKLEFEHALTKNNFGRIPYFPTTLMKLYRTPHRNVCVCVCA